MPAFDPSLSNQFGICRNESSLGMGCMSCCLWGICEDLLAHGLCTFSVGLGVNHLQSNWSCVWYACRDDDCNHSSTAREMPKSAAWRTSELKPARKNLSTFTPASPYRVQQKNSLGDTQRLLPKVPQLVPVLLALEHWCTETGDDRSRFYCLVLKVQSNYPTPSLYIAYRLFFPAVLDVHIS